MKTLIAAALLLALIVPAHAAKPRESDRKWQPMMHAWVDAHDQCLHYGSANEDYETVRDKVCKTMYAAQKKLEAHGYCVYGNGGVGRPSKDRKHCYTIDEPQPEPVMKNFKQGSSLPQ